MKIFKKILNWTIIVAIYLNVGWTLGTHCYYHVHYTTPDTFFNKVLGGGWGVLSHPETPIEKRFPLLGEQIFSSILWPFFIIVFVGGSWLLYFLWEIIAVMVLWKFLICTVIWESLKFLGWVIFMGGGLQLIITHPKLFLTIAIIISFAMSIKYDKKSSKNYIIKPDDYDSDSYIRKSLIWALMGIISMVVLFVLIFN